MDWQTFLIVEVSRQYDLTPTEIAVLLAKFPDENHVIKNRDVAKQAPEDNKLPADTETVRRHLWTIYNKRFCPKNDCDGFPGYDQNYNPDKDVALLDWLRQKYLARFSTQNYNNLSASSVIPDSNKGSLRDNPFIPLKERIEDSAFFFGRSKELRQIFEVINSGSSVALIGEEGIGKSSLLWAVCQQAESYLSSPRQAVYLNLSDVQDDDDFYSALCHEVGIPETKGHSLTRALRLHKHKVLLAIDNVGKLAWTGFTRQLRDQLRSLAETSNAPLKLVLAANEPLEDLFNDSQGDGKTSPLAGICQEENIKAWNETTARDFIQSRLDRGTIRFSEEEINKLVQESGGHPRKLMQLCYQTYSRYLENDNEPKS